MCLSFGGEIVLDPSVDTKDLKWPLEGIILLGINGADLREYADKLLALAPKVAADQDSALRRLWGSAMLFAGFAPSLVADSLR